jgi:hypothetical protein
MMEELGKLDILHFLDLNGRIQVISRPYTNKVRQCDEAIRRLR